MTCRLCGQPVLAEHSLLCQGCDRARLRAAAEARGAGVQDNRLRLVRQFSQETWIAARKMAERVAGDLRIAEARVEKEPDGT